MQSWQRKENLGACGIVTLEWSAPSSSGEFCARHGIGQSSLHDSPALFSPTQGPSLPGDGDRVDGEDLIASIRSCGTGMPAMRYLKTMA